ncbi:hypothetical protein O1611_g4571 [Lasiodiplodia mahajangana]|uniref:Uncharacterized protein n=1 Tax=Lasiodiplodia mahajangana TaxID=1108764 RepID=A0ACC2JNI0_9PEZI|nr:hypothetical protein O1611_g4571 [Lasiodiplodia mahajangana]
MFQNWDPLFLGEQLRTRKERGYETPATQRGYGDHSNARAIDDAPISRPNTTPPKAFYGLNTPIIYSFEHDDERSDGDHDRCLSRRNTAPRSNGLEGRNRIIRDTSYLESNESCFLYTKPLNNSGTRCRDCSILICVGCTSNARLLCPGHSFGLAPARDTTESNGRQTSRQSPPRIGPIQARPPIRTKYSCRFCQQSPGMRYECDICKINLCKDCLQLHPVQHLVRAVECESNANKSVQEIEVLYVLASERTASADVESDLGGLRDVPGTINGNEDGWTDEASCDDGAGLHTSMPIGRFSYIRNQRRSSYTRLRPKSEVVNRQRRSGSTHIRAKGQVANQQRGSVSFACSKKEAIKFVQNARSMIWMIEEVFGIVPNTPESQGPRTVRRTKQLLNQLDIRSTLEGKHRPELVESRRRNTGENDADIANESNFGQGDHREGHLEHLGHNRDLLDFEAPSSDSDYVDEERRRKQGRKQKRRTSYARYWLPADQRRLRELKNKGWSNHRIANHYFANIRKTYSTIF